MVPHLFPYDKEGGVVENKLLLLCVVLAVIVGLEIQDLGLNVVRRHVGSDPYARQLFWGPE